MDKKALIKYMSAKVELAKPNKDLMKLKSLTTKKASIWENSAFPRSVIRNSFRVKKIKNLKEMVGKEKDENDQIQQRK